MGKASKPYFKDGCAEYIKRLKSFYDVSVVEIPEQPTVAKECEEIKKRLGGSPYILLDIKGDMPSSEEFARLVKSSLETRDELAFVIGGASGVNDDIRCAAKRRVSFGAVTYPHQLARLLLLEQLYRAATILNGLPYHK